MSDTCETHWQRALEAQKSRLRAPKYKNILKQIDYDSFHSYLKGEHAHYSQSGLVRVIKTLGPVLNQVDVFVRSLTTMVPGGSGIATLVRGGIFAVLEVRTAQIRKAPRHPRAKANVSPGIQ